MSRIFVDTNIIVYAYDVAAAAKHHKAKQILRDLRTSPQIPVISTQVLQELYNILANKVMLSKRDAQDSVLLFYDLEIVPMTQTLVHAAMDLHASASVQFWDALIIAAAQHAACDELWSEDLQTGRFFGNLKVVNPFTTIP